MNKTIIISIDGLASYYIKNKFADFKHLNEIIIKGRSSLNVKPVYPSLTWPIHTTILTGVKPEDHGIIGNWGYDKIKNKVVSFLGDRYKNAEELIKVPTLFDEAKKFGLTTAALCWPMTKGAKNLDYTIPEFYEQEMFENFSTKKLWHELKEKGFSIGKYAEWSKDHNRGALQDKLTSDIACFLIEGKKAGFILVHFLLPDSFQHDYGTNTDEVKWALEYIDGLCGDIINSVNKTGFMEDTNIIILSDHGFADINRYFLPNMLFKKHGWFLSEESDKNEVITVSGGGSGLVYIKNSSLTDEIKKALLDSGFVDKIFGKNEFSSIGLPEDNEFNLSPDLIFDCIETVSVDVAETDGNIIIPSVYKAMHGYLPEKESMKAIFAAVGPDFRGNKTYDELEISDIYKFIVKQQVSIS